jgi:DNA transformation protein and related proteins
MAISESFVEFLREELSPLGAITVRKMFGGAGVYCRGEILAIIDDDVLYFKVDDRTRPAFEREGTGPFRYATKDGEHVMNGYWRVPERLFDETDELRDWAREALAVSRRTKAKAPKSQSKKPKASSAKKAKHRAGG